MTLPNPWRAPGYYVGPGACAHCGAPHVEHTGDRDYCPRPPVEVRPEPLRGAA